MLVFRCCWTLIHSPTATISASQTSARVGETLDFDGSGSVDNDGSIASYAWDTGDGQTASGAQVSHVWTNPGAYTVTLTVTDDQGATASATVSVTVAGVDSAPPVVSLAAVDFTGTVDDPVIASVQAGTQSVPVTSGSFAFAATLSATPQTISVSAVDAAGNTATRTLDVVP